MENVCLVPKHREENKIKSNLENFYDQQNSTWHSVWPPEQKQIINI